MKIGFDAKRAFHNTTGLGNYSRTLIEGLATYFPGNEYFLFNPKPSALYRPSFESVKEVQPAGVIEKKLSSFWRSSWVKNDLKKMGIDLYHGLSNEIPVGLSKTGIPSVVTVHDLIFERYPQQFNRIDVNIYQKKYRYACSRANRIIAISEQTKKDIMGFYGIDENKIDVCYQSCDPVFSQRAESQLKELIRKQYGLPEAFFLSVGSVIERKNLLNVCKALLQLKDQLNVPLAVIGKGGAYLQKVKTFIAENGLENQVLFLADHPEPEGGPSLREPRTLAAVYQMALALVYPSAFEGFGIPVLEALWSRTPVITSSTSCLPEAGGPGSLYVDPASSDEIANALLMLYNDETLRMAVAESGWAYAQRFTLDKTTQAIAAVYSKTIAHG